MTANEYRKKHKRCATCIYWQREYTNHFWECDVGKCEIKNINRYDGNGRFCKLYRTEYLTK